MKNFVLLWAAMFALASCGPTQEETDAAKAALVKQNAGRGLTCNPATAFKAARTAMYIALKHPESSEIDSMAKSMITTSGDTTTVIVGALATNSFGVKDRVSLMATFVCRHDSLYWVQQIIGGDEVEVLGRPVEAVSQSNWDQRKHEETLQRIRSGQ